VDLDDPDAVREQYSSTARLETRRSVWQPDADGRTAQDVAVAALAELRPRRLLEVGPGTGAFAARCAAELGCEVVAVDSSPAMVAATAAAGVEAMLGDVQQLPFRDGAFDAAVAAWMLYHVPDRDRAIGELARVLRPGGRLIAVTNGREHLAELWRLVEADPGETGFSAENGGDQLRRHFPSVEGHDLRPRALFADRRAVVDYLATLDRADLADRVGELDGPLLARGAATVFVADKAETKRRAG
jgi:SAM-dependent methyltransferase